MSLGMGMGLSLALSLAIASSLCWATLDGLRKYLAERMPAAALVVCFSLLQVPLFVIWWATDGGGIENHAAYWLPAGVGLAFNLAANLLFVLAVQRAPLSLTVPFLAFTPVFTTAVSVPLLHQIPSALEVVGVCVVVLGGVSLGFSAQPSAGESKADTRPVFLEPGVWMMLGVAALWSTTTALDKAATDYAATPVHALVQTGGVGVVLLLSMVARRQLSDFSPVRLHWRPTLLAGAVAAAAFGLQLLAIQGLDAGHVETQKRVIGLVMALVVGRMAFDESITRGKLVAVGIMALGTALVAYGASTGP